MNDEEKKAIETLKNIVIQEYDWWINKGDYAESNVKEANDAIKTILNLIKKQQKEIKELKKPKYIMDFKTNKITTLYNDFISKDKIKEFIKKETKQDTYNFDCISTKKLKELLEEE